MHERLEYSCETPDYESIQTGIIDPIFDLLDRGGKRWRPVLSMLFAQNAGTFDLQSSSCHKDIMYISGMGEIIHNGSLMIDDVEDSSLQRRGQPCTYLKYGTDIAINTGNFMYFYPITLMQNYIKEKHQLGIYQIYANEMNNIHLGQNWDITWHRGG